MRRCPNARIRTYPFARWRSLRRGRARVQRESNNSSPAKSRNVSPRTFASPKSRRLLGPDSRSSTPKSTRSARIDTGKEFDDIKVKLDALTDLPEGAGPIQFIKEFGETSALMLTVASPPANGPQLQLLASADCGRGAVPAPSIADVRAVQFRSPDPSFVREAGGIAGRCPGPSGPRKRSAND